MAQKCKICNHKKRERIDGMLMQNISMSKIAKHYKFTVSCVSRHYHNHLKPYMKTLNFLELPQFKHLREQLSEEDISSIEKINEIMKGEIIIPDESKNNKTIVNRMISAISPKPAEKSSGTGIITSEQVVTPISIPLDSYEKPTIICHKKHNPVAYEDETLDDSMARQEANRRHLGLMFRIGAIKPGGQGSRPDYASMPSPVRFSKD